MPSAPEADALSPELRGLNNLYVYSVVNFVCRCKPVLSKRRSFAKLHGCIGRCPNSLLFEKSEQKLIISDALRPKKRVQRVQTLCRGRGQRPRTAKTRLCNSSISQRTDFAIVEGHMCEVIPKVDYAPKVALANRLPDCL